MKKYAYGVDIGGTTVKIGFFETTGKLVDTWEIPTRTENDGELILPDIAESIKENNEKNSITTDDIVKHLRYIADNEKINITDDALFTIAKNSAGGMRDSIALLDQLSVLDGEEAISTDDINNLLGRLSFDTLNSLADKIVKSDPQGAIEDLEKIYNSGNEPVQILTNLMDYLKNLLIIKNCRKEIVFELTQANEAQVEALTKQIENLETHQIVFLMLHFVSS